MIPTFEPMTRTNTDGRLGRIGRLAFRRRGTVLLAWFAGLLVAAGLSLSFGGDFTADYSAPRSESQRAQRLLAEQFAGQSGASVAVVIHADGGVEAIRADVTRMLGELRGNPHVTSVDDPYTTPGAVAADGSTLIADLRLDVESPAEMPVEDTGRLIDVARAYESDRMHVALGGPVIGQAEDGAIGSEGIGLAAAAVILLFTFGSVVAAGLPIIVAVAGLAVSAMLTGLVIRLVDAPVWSTSLAAMLGIGVGIDYVLLMVTRFREFRRDGYEPQDAAAAALDTAGRSVLVAGVTVIVSMLGLFAMGLSYMRGAALVAIVGVLVVLVAAVTLFPALLGYLGAHIDRLRLPTGRRGGGDAKLWPRWSGFVRRHRVLAAVGGTAAMLALALPFLAVQFGFPDAGNDQPQTMTRQAYDAIERGFGTGANGPLHLVAEVPAAGGPETLERLRTAAAATPGVASVTPGRFNQARTIAVLTLVPQAGPQDKETQDLVRRLRQDTVPAAVQGTGVIVHVGGPTATSIDSTEDLAGRIPYLIAGVVLLSLVLLLAEFRGIAVALKAAVLNLLSVAAAYGVVALVLQGGWAGRLVGIDTPTPLPPFVTVLMFAVLFGLSMDYEVFLLSRIREIWQTTGDHTRAVTEGLAGTGRVITAAAAVMVAVFLAFAASPDIILKQIGVGMAAAILLDATLVRLVLVPAALHLLGRFTWWSPFDAARPHTVPRNEERVPVS